MANTNSKRALVIAAAVAAMSLSSEAAFITKASNTVNLNDGGSWVGGTAGTSAGVPGSGDVALWDTTSPGGTFTLGDNLSWGGLQISTPTGNVTFNSGPSLTLGTDGVVIPGGRTLTVNGGIALSASQTWNNNALVAVGGTLNLGANTLTLIGTGTKQLKGAVSGSGTMVVNDATTLKFTNSTGYASSATVNVTNPGGTLQFETNTGVPSDSALRVGTANINGNLAIGGNSGFDAVENIGNLATTGNATVTITPHTAKNTTLHIGTFQRTGNGTVLFRGTSLGNNPTATPAANAVNVTISNVPSLIGAGAPGSASAAFIKGAFGDTDAAGAGSAAATGGLVTYDAAKGIRLLDTATEYDTRAANGSISTTSNNVRVTGAAAENRTMTIASAGTTSVGSLTLVYSGATVGGSGVTVDGETTGTGTLQVSTGVIQVGGSLASNAAGIGTTDAFYIKTATLDLNGTEGMVRAVTPTSTTGTIQTAARLCLNTVITNDGGNGVTFSSGGTQGAIAGMVSLGGSTANTYTGTTTVNGGIVTLAKPAGVNAVPSDLVLNSGSIYLANHNQIADAADVTINGGAIYFADANNSGSGRGDTFASLTMTGGTTSPASTSGQTVRVTGNANLSGGTFAAISNGKVTVDGSVALSGGKINVGGSGSPSAFGSLTTVGGLSITNIASGSYTPITINGGTANRGGKLVLNGNVSFTGNAANSNAVTIAAASAANLGVIALEGSRTFDIGDGAALSDLIVQPALVDGAVSGVLTKTGVGSLVLTGASTYTGNTTINEGVLALGAAGSIATSPRIEITAGASLDTSAQSFAMLASQAVVFGLDATGAGSAGVLDAGALDLNSGSIELAIVGTLDDEAYVLATYTSLVGTFASAPAVAGYEMDYAYQGNSIALVAAIPEPGTMALAATVAGFALSMRRRRHA